MKNRVEIEAEIKALSVMAKDYDTERQSNDTCVAAGAHDALRWGAWVGRGFHFRRVCPQMITQPDRAAAIELLAALPLLKHAALDEYMRPEHLEALGEVVRGD